MSPEEVQLLGHVGQVVMSNLILVVTEATFCGIYLVLTLIAMHSLWKRGLKSKSTLIQFLAILIVFIAFTLHFTSVIAVTSGILRGDLISSSDRPLKTRLQLGNTAVTPWVLADMWLSGSNQGILFWIGDAVVVWRACTVMKTMSKKIKYGLVLFYFIGVILAIAEVLLEILTDPLAEALDIGSTQAILQLLSGITFVGVNATATALIACLAYKHRKTLKQDLGRNQSQSSKILMLLVESGAIYCSIQTIALVLSYVDVNPFELEDRVYEVWLEFAVFASAIYPTAVILLAHQQSIADSPDMTEIIQNARSDIQFAHTPPVGNATDSLFVDTPRDENNDRCGDVERNQEVMDAPELGMGGRLVRSCP